MSPLFVQFVAEGRELLEQSQRLLVALERAPEDGELVAALFRALHTFKGAAGMFPYGALTRVVHAGEDVLAAVRRGELPFTSQLCELIFLCVDRAGAWLEHAAESEALPAGADAEAERVALQLRALLSPAAAVAAPAADPAAPRALSELPPGLRAAAEARLSAGEAAQHVRYRPDPQCFFSGEDPLRLMRLVPSVEALLIEGPAGGFGPLPEHDPFQCALSFELVTSAPRAELDQLFQYVEDQVEIRPVQAAGAAAPAPGAAPPPPVAAAPEPAAPPPVAAGTRRADRPGALLKVDQAKVDLIMNLVGELVVAKNGLPYLSRRAESQYQAPELAVEIKEQYAVLHRIAEALQGAVMQVRMLPMSVLFERYIRLVRDLSRKLGKEVELVIEGETTEADKGVVDRLGDPLLHLLRNSLDHGLETPEARRAAGKAPSGTLRLRAQRDGDRLNIEIIDDGRGIDPDVVRRKAAERGVASEARLGAMAPQEVIELIFAPGFSTAEAVSDVSGRGVGMDVVRRDVEAMGGAVTVRSQKGRGTTVRLSVPLTMAVTRTLLVSACGELFGVPMESVVGAVRVPRAEIRPMKQHEVLLFRGRLVPVLSLGDLLELPRDEASLPEPTAPVSVLIVEVGDSGVGEVGLVVDSFQQDVDVVLKPMSGVLAGCRGFSGTAILGDGRALLVLNLWEVLSCRSTPRMSASTSAA